MCLNSVVFKILEHNVHDQLIAYLIETILIFNDQQVFLTKDHTNTNLLECLNSWTNAIYEKKSVKYVYVDMAKAFNTVSHVKFIRKLRLIGICGSPIT